MGKDNDNTDKPVVVKKYANRRLYNTDTSSYVTLEDLAQMVRSDRDFVVYDAKSNEDLTHAVLTQIIVEQESKGQNLLPIPFLRQLIRFYDDSMGRLIPSYLQLSLDSLTKEQEKFRAKMNDTFGISGFEIMQEQARKNFAAFEQALTMFSPFAANAEKDSGPVQKKSKSDKSKKQSDEESADSDESLDKEQLDALKTQLAVMQEQIEKLSK